MIIGVTGTNGSGKGTVVDYLVTKGFVHYSARDFIAEEIQKRGLEVNRDTLRMVANDLRQKNGPAFIIESLYAKAQEKGGDAVIESIRNIGEAAFLKEHGAVLLATDASRQLRYERITLRGSATDHISYEKFCEQEDRELDAPDPWDMSVFGVMQMADYTIMNIGTPADLPPRIDAIVDRLRR
jgi:dephospho-CoA kinase